MYEHRNKLADGFTSKYNVNKLVYYDYVEDIESAITREKQIKGWKRQKKIELIESVNPDWYDLIDSIQN
jgi:putative endonuclease